ncbi:heterokaryon incompatibility protein-domain-containing protein [Dactylonectria estremocensis]|uniref:Heterokaryon incompatibility protein-domain-containing protein n=1 Tax=Dactylonectria estremocensis TaxID=1079267 RepID=A0A9P9JC20_9HYPO|nr:heterokaryon incompatibility protein-domain-containing protein [Dactylonectria estremocensis]
MSHHGPDQQSTNETANHSQLFEQLQVAPAESENGKTATQAQYASNHMIQDYQLRLMLLEQQNKRRLERQRNPWVTTTQKRGFPYHTISQSQDLREIRLLRLLPRTPISTVIETELLIFEFASCPDFVALSYVWGPPSSESSIKINGCQLSVRTGLLTALIQMHHDLDASTYLWIDAVCINQSDANEKSHVVQHMGAIYERARCVYAWLGGSLFDASVSPGSHLIQQLSFLGRLFWDASPERHQIETTTTMRELVLKCWPTIAYMFQLPIGQGGFLIPAYQALCEREYWTRIWVLQEVHLAKEIDFHIGDQKISLKLLSGAFALLQALQTHLFTMPPHDRALQTTQIHAFMHEVTPFPQMHRLVLYTSLYPSEILSLRIAMTNFCIKDAISGARATDPRDMIYGLLGFATNDEKGHIVPNYGLSICDTYHSVTRTFLAQGWTDVLAWAQGHNKRVRGLPTWVPDYSGTIHETICSKSQAKGWMPFFKASGNTQLSIGDNPWISSMISLAGVSVDNISIVGNASPTLQKCKGSDLAKGTTMVPTSHILLFLEEAQTLYHEATQAASLNPHASPCLTDGQAMWRVPIADQIVLRRGITRCQSDFPAVYQTVQSSLRLNIVQGLPIPQDARPYIDGILLHKNRQIFVTDHGYLGLGPAEMKYGDKVVVLFGFQSLFVIRPQADLSFSLVGEAYVHGIMDGEFLQKPFETEVFNLV